LTYRVSLSRLFNDGLDQIKEFDSTVNVKRVAASIKQTAKDLDKIEKSSGITIETTRIKVKVPNTQYIVVYKVKNNPKKILIVKRILTRK